VPDLRQSAARPFSLAGKLAAVTGGGSGIGRSICLRFAAAGAKVHVLDISQQEADATRDLIVSNGGCAAAYACDVAQGRQVDECFARITAGEKLSILVNNAGISHIGTVETTSEEDLDRTYSVNVKGFFNCIRACIPGMKAAGGGVILNLASVAASAGIPDRFAYSVSKGAVIAMTLSVARDYVAHNIRCNCISPARVHTPFVDGYLKKNYPGKEQEMFERLAQSQPLGRMAEPEEVASLALFLCSDEASFLTGVDYPLDGGYFNLRG